MARGLTNGRRPGDVCREVLRFGSSPTMTYSANQDGTGGTLTVTDGVDTAQIDLVGQYDAAGFTASADVGTGTLIEYVLTGLTPTT